MNKREKAARAACKVAGLNPNDFLAGKRRWEHYLPLVDAIVEVWEDRKDMDSVRAEKKCDTCRFCLLEDYGYSNYTTEGTYVHCLKSAHPESGFDRFYGAEARLAFAENCFKYERGNPVKLDCDREMLVHGKSLSASYTDDAEIKPLIDAWENLCNE